MTDFDVSSSEITGIEEEIEVGETGPMLIKIKPRRKRKMLQKRMKRTRRNERDDDIVIIL